MLNPNIFKILGYVEGLSLLMLLFVAMPIKYMLGNPEWVRIVGAVHGGLFVLYVYVSIHMREDLKWSWAQVVKAWILASIPFGPLFVRVNAR